MNGYIYVLYRLTSKTPVFGTMRHASDLTLQAVYCKMRDEAAADVTPNTKGWGSVPKSTPQRIVVREVYEDKPGKPLSRTLLGELIGVTNLQA